MRVNEEGQEVIVKGMVSREILMTTTKHSLIYGVDKA